MHRRLALGLTGALVLAGAGVTAEAGIVQDFSGFPAGTVIAGQEPQGGNAPGTAFSDFTVSVVNAGGGPQSCIIFDSSNPTGEDPDLGTPNATCPGGGPGIGAGGEVGQPGENCVALGNLLIVAEDIVDANNDNLVDDPDDEAGGGAILFEFSPQVVPVSVTILDIDVETASATLSNDTLTVQVDANDLGDNSAQTLDLSGQGPFRCLLMKFSSSGAVAEIEYDRATPTETTSWGRVKSSYREERAE